MCPEYIAGWCAKLGIATPDESREYLDEVASFFVWIGRDILSGKRVALGFDGDRRTEKCELYFGRESSRFRLKLNDRWLLLALRTSTFWGATAPYARTWRAVTPVCLSAKMKL